MQRKTVRRLSCSKAPAVAAAPARKREATSIHFIINDLALVLLPQTDKLSVLTSANLFLTSSAVGQSPDAGRCRAAADGAGPSRQCLNGPWSTELEPENGLRRPTNGPTYPRRGIREARRRSLTLPGSNRTVAKLLPFYLLRSPPTFALRMRCGLQQRFEVFSRPSLNNRSVRGLDDGRVLLHARVRQGICNCPPLTR